MPQDKPWTMQNFEAKGDSLYRAEASGADVYDKDYPDISRFDKSGYETDEYILRGLTDGKVDRNVPGGGRGSFTYTGTNKEGEPVKGKRTYSQTGGMTPRKSYYMDQSRELEKGMPMEDKASWMYTKMAYGDKPRYSSKGDIISPHVLQSYFKDKTSGMDPFQKMDFRSDFEGMVKSIPTTRGPSDGKVMDHVKRQ